MDFALSQYVDDAGNVDIEKWAINYAAPELIKGVITLGSDIFSAGSIILNCSQEYLLLRQEPITYKI